MMEEAHIEEALRRAESALAQGDSLEGTGFWKAVAELRHRDDLLPSYGERVSSIDMRAFEQGVRLRVHLWAGNVLLTVATAAGIVALSIASRFDAVVRDVLFLAGLGILDVSTHSLAHFVVGRLFGIRFTHYFLGGPPPPRPGVKVEYASYLRTPPRRRAIMHASGAVVTKLIPFALLPVGIMADVSSWVIVVLMAIGVFQIATDIALSTKTSDWKKVRREWKLAG